MTKILIPYDKAKTLINEGDILLFRGTGFFSHFIQRYGESSYSHVGIASWVNGGKPEDILECVEFREKYGGRSVNLHNYVHQYPNIIDVYRPIPYFLKTYFCPHTKTITVHRKEFNGKLVTKTARKGTALPYGYKRIVWILFHKMPFLRLFYNINKIMEDELKEVVYPVCSTWVSYSFNKHGYDLVCNRSDEFTEPADIARSGRISYLFTLSP